MVLAIVICGASLIVVFARVVGVRGSGREDQEGEDESEPEKEPEAEEDSPI
jgi:hypothetical protein